MSLPLSFYYYFAHPYYKFLTLPKEIDWEILLGISGRSPNLKGTFRTSIHHFDHQGEKRGETYVKYLGQHYHDYENGLHTKKMGPRYAASLALTALGRGPFIRRSHKEAATSVIGLFCEVLTSMVMTKLFALRPFQMNHIMGNLKTPDYIVHLKLDKVEGLFNHSAYNYGISRNKQLENQDLLYTLSQMKSASLSIPVLPVECKSSTGADVDKKSALVQLLSYWMQVPGTEGYGVISRFSMKSGKNRPKLQLYLLIPAYSATVNISGLNEKSTVTDFVNAIGGSLVGK
jgi:hypothetical protein